MNQVQKISIFKALFKAHFLRFRALKSDFYEKVSFGSSILKHKQKWILFKSKFQRVVLTVPHYVHIRKYILRNDLVTVVLHFQLRGHP